MPTAFTKQGADSPCTRRRGALATEQDSLSLDAPAIVARGPVSAGGSILTLVLMAKVLRPTMRPARVRASH